MAKSDSFQLSFDFDGTDFPSFFPDSGISEDSYMTFPMGTKEVDVLSQVSEALYQIDQCMAPSPSVVTWVFHAVFIEGLTPLELVKRADAVPYVRSSERIRQIAKQLKIQLLNGQRIKELRHARLQSSLSEQLRELKECEMADPDMYGRLRNVLPGVVSLLGYRFFTENDKRLPMLTQPLILGESIALGSFMSHFLAIFFTLQEEVRPISLSTLIPRMLQQVNMCDVELDCKIVKMVLGLRRYIVLERGTNGEAWYSLRFEYLRIYQKMARIVYERKSVSYKQILDEIKSRGENIEKLFMSVTSKRYPWCVPMGKSLWKYCPQGGKFQSIQQIIKEYCEEKVRFTYDELKETLTKQGYEMKERALRNYIMHHCRTMNADNKRFCLTSAVTEEEDRLYRRKSIIITENQREEYYDRLSDIARDMLLRSEQHVLPLATIKNECMDYMKEKGIPEHVFYRMMNVCEEFSKFKSQHVTMLQLKASTAK